MQKALELGIIEAPTDYEHLTDAALVLVAVPVNYIGQVLALVLDKIGDDTLVMDVGSVKSSYLPSGSSPPTPEAVCSSPPNGRYRTLRA